MGRYLVLWHTNPSVMPTAPVEKQKHLETAIAGVDGLIKKGLVKEMGYFLGGSGGYAIAEGEAADVFGGLYGFPPFYEPKVQEIMPWDKGKEIAGAGLKAK